MKITLILLIICGIGVLRADQVTIYNNDFALVRTDIVLELDKGLQDYFLDKIPSTIEPASVIVKGEDGKPEIFSQNYEYDLANTAKILQKYIGKDISLMTKTDNKFSGVLQFNDFNTIGLIDANTGELNLIQTSEIRNLILEELPENFFLKPTLHWQLYTDKSGEYPVEMSYLCSGMRWDVTYNGVWNDRDEELEIKAWVTITNETGKGYRDSKLKLVAGDVRKIIGKAYRDDYDNLRGFEELYDKAAPDFTEKAFHDFHLYTLSENITINNRQTKQMRLFPAAVAKAGSRYEYVTNTDKIISMIEFTNSTRFNLGIPLPRGVFKIYKLDEADDNLEFIGEDRIDHTAKNQEVKLTTGYAFDLIGETVLVDQRKEGKKIHERDMKVIVKNMSEEEKTINIIHNLSGFWLIKNNSIGFEELGDNRIEFTVELGAGKVREITWTDRIEY